MIAAASAAPGSDDAHDLERKPEMSVLMVRDDRSCYPTELTEAELDYVCSKGPDFYLEERLEKMPETDQHHRVITMLEDLLKGYFGSGAYYGVPFLYWVRDNNKVAAAPDLFVVKGLTNEPRDTFKTWNEGDRTPNVVFEVL